MWHGVVVARIRRRKSARLVFLRKPAANRVHDPMKRTFCFLLLLIAVVFAPAATNEPFTIRGYYTTFMRMPTFGLPEWKQMIDCMEDDGANFLILWTAGGFRSKQFPITWKYNAEHKNVQHD